MDRKTRTRERIQATALELFETHGFNGVTVEQIANELGMSHMTIYRHFHTKEALVFDDPYDPVIADAVKNQDRRLPPFERVRRGYLETLRHSDPAGDVMIRRRVKLAVDSPEILGRVWENNYRTSGFVEQVLIEDGVGLRQARVASGAVLGAITFALITWADDPDAPELRAYLTAALADLGETAVVTR